MKIQSILAIVSSLLVANIGAGSELHKSDRALETNLRQALNQRHVHIEVHDGIVTIEGEVRTEQDRQTIDSVVRNTAGVAAVKDKLKVQAWAEQDGPTANKLARQLRPETLPASGLDNVTITVRNRTVTLEGTVNTRQAHDALITAIQQSGGVSAIYDQLQIR